MITNKTRKKALCEKERHCRDIFSRSLGLMFSLRPKTLVFSFRSERIVPLHMVFVFYPIDVVFLDSSMKVLEIKEDFRPFAFFWPKKKARYVIELPAGSIKNTETAIGDIIEIESKEKHI